MLADAFDAVMTSGEPSELCEVFEEALEAVVRRTPKKERDAEALATANRVRDRLLKLRDPDSKDHLM